MITFLVVIQCVWLILPAGVANMSAQLASVFFPNFNYPMDFNLSIKGIRILGSHKTIRGLLVGVVFSILFFSFQKYLYINNELIRNICLFDYSIFPFYFGSVFGLGAIFGDALKSFFKRRVGIDPGKSWFPFDQIDWTLGAIVAISPFISLKLNYVVISILTGLIIHLISKIIGFLIGTEKSAI